MHYRLYCLNERNKITHGEDVDAADDEAAIAHVQTLGKTTDCELWCGTRIVARITAQGVVRPGR